MINTIIFDLGAVLIDWNPEYLYRNHFETEEEMRHFLTNVATPEKARVLVGSGSLDAVITWLETPEAAGSRDGLLVASLGATVAELT